MGCMGHTDGPGSPFDMAPHPLVEVVKSIPGYGCFQGVDGNAVIIQVFPHVGLRVPGFLPLSGSVPSQIKGTAGFGHRPDFAFHHPGIIPVPFNGAEAETPLHGFETAFFEEHVHRPWNAVKLEAPVRLFRV